MSHTSPRFINQEYNETINLLAVSSSERAQFAIIKRFLQLYIDDFDKAESYIKQLIPEIPLLTDPFLLAGLRPSEIEIFLEMLSICREKKISVSGITLEELIDGYSEALLIVHSWLGVKEIAPGSLISVHKEGELKKDNDEASLLVPVVEKIGNELVSRLRSCCVTILGETKEDSLSATFGVVGAESFSFLVPVKHAVQSLYGQTNSGGRKHWAASVKFKLTHAWHSGRSANLAISGLYYCELLKSEEQAEYFELNPAACVTGDISDSGEVLKVDSNTLPKKIEAAFFSWAHVLVVPVEQLSQTLGIIDELQMEFPNRHLPVIGIGSLRELFYDRRIATHIKTGVVAHNLKKIWKRKFSVTTGIIILVLGLIIGRLIIGPIDKNPVAVEFAGTLMILNNEEGQVVGQIEVGQDFVNHHNRFPKSQRYLLVDTDKDKINEVIFSIPLQYYTNNDTLYCFSISKDEYLWKTEISFDLDYSHRPDIKGLKWGIRLIIAQETKEGTNIFAAVGSTTYFPSVITKVNPYDGELVQNYVNPGSFGDMKIVDMNNDGESELLLLMNNNSFWGATLTLLDPEDITGHAPSFYEHKAQGIPYNKIFGTVFFPKSVIDKVYNFSKGTFVNQSVQYEEDEWLVTVQAYATRYNPYIIDASSIPALIYTFDKNLEVVGLGSSDGWDIYSRKYYKEGKLPFEPGLEYLRAFKDSLLWWDGEKLVNTPTLVNDYDKNEGDSER